MNDHRLAATVAAARAISVPEVAVVEDLALYLRCSPATVRRLLRTGVLPGRKIGRRWVIERHALLRAVAPSDGHGRTLPTSLHLLRGADTAPRGGQEQ